MEKIRILVVDDEEFVCDSLILKIGRLKHPTEYEITSCTSANRAISLVNNNQYDAIITDIKMPFISGLQLIKELREKAFSGKIFVLSSYDDYNYVRQAFVNGADDYLLKPIAVVELDKKFKEVLLPNLQVELKRQTGGTERLEQKRINVISYAEEYIKLNYSNSNLNMTEVADHLSLSYSHFSNLFRKETKSTFPDYLRRIRIEKAIDMLEDPTMKISDISYRVGFKYPQQFSKDFKIVTGVYPTEYYHQKHDF